MCGRPRAKRSRRTLGSPHGQRHAQGRPATRVGYLGSAMLKRSSRCADGQSGRGALVDGQLTQTESLDYAVVPTAPATSSASSDVERVRAVRNMGRLLDRNDAVDWAHPTKSICQDGSCSVTGRKQPVLRSRPLTSHQPACDAFVATPLRRP